MSRQLGGTFHQRIVTRAYDLGVHALLQGIRPDSWLSQESGVEVYYDSLKPGRLSHLVHLISEYDPDVVYLNSLYSVKFTFYPILAHRWLKHRSRIIVAPRGMLKESALRLKFIKKFLFIKAVRGMQLQKGIEFHGTNVKEGEEIRKALGGVRVHIIGNLAKEIKSEWVQIGKSRGQLNIITVSRVHPVKNLHYFLTILRQLAQPVKFSIIGNVEDMEYFRKCQEILSQLPVHIHVDFLGDIPHHEISPRLESNHLFVLPTLGENFGHAILEALSSGRPVLISDQTPWRNLEEAKAGWDLPLSDPGQWLKKLEEAASWDQEEFDAWCRGAQEYARVHTNTTELIEKYKKMFSES